ncbi:MAG: CC0125/CC1285 family lipoprotein [bacterium]
MSHLKVLFNFNFFSLVLTVCLLTGCASGYHEFAATGGYSEFKLQDNTWVVSYSGNGYTPSDQAGEYTLVRAAEIAQAEGFDYFLVEDRKTNFKDFETWIGSGTKIYRPHVSYTIKLLKKEVPEQESIHAPRLLKEKLPYRTTFFRKIMANLLYPFS